MQKLPNEIIIDIINKIDIKTCLAVASTNKFFRNYYKELVIEEMKLKISKFIDLSSKTILVYLSEQKLYKEYEYEQTNPLNYDEYDQITWFTYGHSLGANRAFNFLTILNNNNLSLPFKLLAIYTLLTEKNGTKLKKLVLENLQSIHSFDLSTCKKLLMLHYKLTEQSLINCCKNFIKHIHHYHNQCLNYMYDQPDCFDLTINNEWAKGIEQLVLSDSAPISHKNQCMIS